MRSYGFYLRVLNSTHCKNAALAAVGNAAFDVAENEGTDYPESMNISRVDINDIMPGKTAITFYSNSTGENLVYTVIVNNQIDCLASRATVGKQGVKPGDLKKMP